MSEEITHRSIKTGEASVFSLIWDEILLWNLCYFSGQNQCFTKVDPNLCLESSDS